MLRARRSTCARSLCCHSSCGCILAEEVWTISLDAWREGTVNYASRAELYDALADDVHRRTREEIARRSREPASACHWIARHRAARSRYEAWRREGLAPGGQTLFEQLGVTVSR